MSAPESFYDFHGLVSMQIIDHQRGGLQGLAYLTDSFSYFRVDSLSGAADITLELGDFETHSAGCCLVDHKVHVRRNYLYCADGWRGFRWQVEIDGFEHGPTHVRLAMRGGGLRGALLPGMYSTMLLARQLLAQKLRSQGWALAHAAGASRDGRAVVLFGRGGSYKTGVLMALLRSSPKWRALGDDGVLLKGDRVLSFPTYPAIFKYRLKNKDNEHLTHLDRLRMGMRPPDAVMAKDCYSPGADLAALVEMRAGGVDKLTIEEVPAAQTVAAMFAGMRLEQHNSVNMGFNDVYPQYREAYAYIFPENGLTTEKEPAVDYLDGVCRRVHLPGSPTRDDFESVCVMLNAMVSG